MDDYLNWAELYFKYKDAYAKEIQSISKEKDFLVLIKSVKGVEQKEKIVVGTNFQEYVQDAPHFDKYWVLISNEEESVLKVVDSWKILSVCENIRIVFVKPKQNKSWMLHPCSHAKISDSSRLKEGLLSLYQNS